MTNLYSMLKIWDISLPTEVCIVKAYSFSSSHVWMWQLNHKEGWMLKNWCFWAAVLENTPESPLDCKEIQLVHSKGNQPWIFIGRTDAEVKAPIVWRCDVKSQLIRKEPDAGKDWRQEKGMTEDEVVGWHHWLDGQEFEQALVIAYAECSKEDLASGPATRLDHSRAFVQQNFIKVWNAQGKLLTDIRMGVESAPLISVSKGVISFFN